MLNTSDTLADLKTQMSLLMKEQTMLQNTNADLLAKLDKVTQENIELRSKCTKISEDSGIKYSDAASKTLLIGNSLLRNIESKDSSKIDVSCFSGATFESLNAELKNIQSEYKKIVIVTGTTDCRDANTTTAKINDTAHSLLTEAKKHTQSVIISSVLPRIDSDNPGCQLKIDTVNENIRKLCSDNLCTFVDNDGVFKLSDSSPNDSMLSYKL